jgi:thioredoxin-related protein
MKLISLLLISVFAVSTAQWQTDFEKAKKQANTEHKLILLNFSGSDWCIPCMRMHREIFDSEVFDKYASQNLVLVNANFPRLKKNKPDKQVKLQNEALAALYNKEGRFPFTVLLNTDGKVLRTWDGMPDIAPDEFVNQVKAIADAGH